MPTSPTSSELVWPRQAGPASAYTTVARLVGHTPLLQLQRAADGLVWVKLEGANPGGSIFDRLVEAVLQATPSQPLAVHGASALAVSAAMLGAAHGVPVSVIVGPHDPGRTRELCRRYGADVRVFRDVGRMEEHVAALSGAGVRWVSRDDVGWEPAWLQLADEAVASRTGPRHVVVPAYGARSARRAFAGLDAEVQLLEVEDDHELPLSLDEDTTMRRTWTGHREGFLTGPVGAAIVDQAIDRATETGEVVLAVVPDGGHRYLGWW